MLLWLEPHPNPSSPLGISVAAPVIGYGKSVARSVMRCTDTDFFFQKEVWFTDIVTDAN